MKSLHRPHKGKYKDDTSASPIQEPIRQLLCEHCFALEPLKVSLRAAGCVEPPWLPAVPSRPHCQKLCCRCVGSLLSRVSVGRCVAGCPFCLFVRGLTMRGSGIWPNAIAGLGVAVLRPTPLRGRGYRRYRVPFWLSHAFPSSRARLRLLGKWFQMRKSRTAAGTSSRGL